MVKGEGDDEGCSEDILLSERVGKRDRGRWPSEAFKVGLLYDLVAIHKLTRAALAPLMHTCNAPRLWRLPDCLRPLYTYN